MLSRPREGELAIGWNVHDDFAGVGVVMNDVLFRTCTAWLPRVFVRAPPRLADVGLLAFRVRADVVARQHERPSEMVWAGSSDRFSALLSCEVLDCRRSRDW